jgi:hypothetical protein
MPKIQMKRGNLDEHDPWMRHRLPYNMDLWSFASYFAVLTINDQTIADEKTFEEFPILPDAFPSSNTQAANKQYVDYAITPDNLSNLGYLGDGSGQIARGDHTHANLPTDDQKDALDSAQAPDAGNPFVVWDQFSDHSARHKSGAVDAIVPSVTRVTASPYTILASDDVIFVDTDGGDIIVNLPVGVVGTRYRIVNTGTSGNSVTLAPNGLELLNGFNASESLEDSESLDINFEATEGWY